MENTSEQAPVKPVESEKINLTHGQRMVGLNFNPSGDNKVDRVKMHHANIIDGLEELRKESTSDIQKEFIKQASDAVIVSQMLAVKAITWKD